MCSFSIESGIDVGETSSIHSANNSTSRRYADRVFAAEAVSDASKSETNHRGSRLLRTEHSPFSVRADTAWQSAHVATWPIDTAPMGLAKESSPRLGLCERTYQEKYDANNATRCSTVSTVWPVLSRLSTKAWTDAKETTFGSEYPDAAKNSTARVTSKLLDARTASDTRRDLM